MEFSHDFEVIDILASEYGWSIDYIQELDINEIQGLIQEINTRNVEHYKMLSYISVLAFSGKTIDSILNVQPVINKEVVESKEDKEKIDSQREKQQEQMMIKLFTSLGMKPQKLKESLDKGKLEI